MPIPGSPRVRKAAALCERRRLAYVCLHPFLRNKDSLDLEHSVVSGADQSVGPTVVDLQLADLHYATLRVLDGARYDRVGRGGDRAGTADVRRGGVRAG